jgi:tripartite-type tricarboxylate transporter receptor subunit TctC
MPSRLGRPCVAAAAVVAIVALAGGASAQAPSNRLVHFVVPQPAGGSMDANARALSEPLERALGQKIVIDNHGGANGIIAGELVAKAVADGTTVLYTSNSFVNNQIIYKKLPFDLRRDFIPVTLVARLPGYMVLVNPKVPAHSIPELVALSRTAAPPLYFGSSGIGNSAHLLGELLNARANAKLVHVPYKGLAPMITALLGNEIQVAFAAPTTIVEHVKDGRLRAIAYTGTQRWAALPDVPTVDESGVPGFVFDDAWHGIFAPAGTSPEAVAKLRDSVAAALAQPKIRDFLATGGYVPVGDTSEEFRRFLDGYLKNIVELAAIAHVQPE